MALSIVDKTKINRNIKLVKSEQITYEIITSDCSKNYSVSELLEYFIENILKKLDAKEEIKNQSFYRLVAAVFALVEYAVIESKNIKSSLLDQIGSLEDKYEEYLDNNKFEQDELVSTLLNKLTKLYLSSFAFDPELYKKRQIEEQDAQVLKEENKDNKDNNERIIKEYQKQISNLERCLKKQEKKLKDSQTIQTKCKNNAQSLQNEVKKYQTEIKELKDKIKKMDDVSLSYETLQNKYQKLILSSTKKEKRLENIKGNIILLIMNQEYTLNEIVQILNDKNYNTNTEEVYELIMQLKRDYNIVAEGQTIPKKFKIGQVENHSNAILNVPVSSSKCVSILLVADEHIANNNEDSYTNFDPLYNYCVENNISTILHLGDFLSFYDIFGKKIERYHKYMQEIELLLKYYPKDSSITNIYLGGNHEKRMFTFGIDPVEYVTQKRDDFVSIGYTDAILNVGKEKLGLHHPNKKELIEIRDSVKSFLNNYYINNGITKDDIYLNLLGHYHRCYLNQEDSYFLVPSYCIKKGLLNSACHLKIYLDSDEHINNIVINILPMIGYKKKLVSSGEIEYKKIYRLEKNYETENN